MYFDFEDSQQPLFLQISDQIKDGILKGIYGEETQIPSSTEISLFYKINPATVNKGVNLLVDEGIIYKKRGIGMFVCGGALQKLRDSEANVFFGKFVEPMLEQAEKLGISGEEIIEMIKNYHGK